MQIHCFYLLLLFFIAIVIFIGHGSDPHAAFQMPPSSDEDAGRLIFLNRSSEFKQKSVYLGSYCTTSTVADSSSTNYNKKYDDLSNFQLAAGKTLFICQACYSGNVVDDMAESK